MGGKHVQRIRGSRALPRRNESLEVRKLLKSRCEMGDTSHMSGGGFWHGSPALQMEPFWAGGC